VDEPLDVVPGVSTVPPAPIAAGPPGIPGAPAPVLAPLPDYTEEDLMVLSETCWSAPNIILPAVPVPSMDRLRMFNKQLYLYCRKKGINPWEWFFDEFGLLIAGAGCAGEMYRGYMENRAHEKKADGATPLQKGDEDYIHQQELYRGYMENRAHEKKADGATPLQKGDEDYIHQQELAKLQEDRLKEGVIKEYGVKGAGLVPGNGPGNEHGPGLDQGYMPGE
jgi:hypothetical protein